MVYYGIADDYESRRRGLKRDYLTLWSGAFMSTYEGYAVSLPKRDGYMIHMLYGPKVRVICPVGRTDDNYQEIDDAIRSGLNGVAL